MNDEAPATGQTAPKKPPSNAGGPRGNKKSISGPKPTGSPNPQANARPISRTGSRKASNAAGGADSGSDTAAVRKASDSNKKPQPQHNKNQSASQRPQQQQQQHRKGPSASQAVRSNSNNNSNKSSPNPAADSSEAMNSLQRVIADLKTTSSSPTPPAPPGNFGTPTSAQGSNLPANAPVFQPGANAYPGPDMKHRKAASSGPGLSGNFNSFSPGLGAMMEDAEDAGHMEEGEIQDQYAHPTHQPRSQSQSFMAPRFAALAASQDDSVGPTGRPQLAPNFSFGARPRQQQQQQQRGMGPPISEEDLGFQFPQQQQQLHHQPQQSFQQDRPAPSHQKTESTGEINGIMAEQIALQQQIEALQHQQQALYQQQLSSNQVLSYQTPGLAPNRGVHRRVQSTVPMNPAAASFGANPAAPGQYGNMGMMGLDGQPQGLPRGHGRRHSVNVVNKQGAPMGGSISYPNPYNGQQEGYDDGFAPPFNAHSRQVSRADNSWRLNGGVGGIPGNGATSELAQAQAQLQSLQQFRQAAGGHHHKMASFSFPNMLPNMMAANMMGLSLGGMNLLQQQQQQFQSQLQQQSNQPQRKSLFAPYLPQASLPPLLAAGKLVVGILRVNKRNRSDAYVATEVLDADIYICGSKDRNRALEGDIVAVELLDVDEVWGTKKEKEEKKRKKEENAAYDKTGAGRKDDKKKDDVEVEGQGLMLFEDEEVTDEIKPQFAGHVVAVVERMPGQLFSGTLGLLRPSSAATKEKQEAERREREGDRGEEPKRGPIERPKIVWFKPTDKRVPLIAIPTEQAPPDFVQNSEAYVDKLFVACIKRHPISSLHPFGTLVEELGPIGDIEVETSALLKDCNFPTEDFTENVIKCLPPLPFLIPDHEIEARKDLREERIFTIDPTTAKDLDDAVSIKANADGTYEVGVHITDVSYFVKPNTALDRDARKRATSVYLVQRSVPMLPPTLSEQLCSLIPGQDRLAFSVIFTLSKEAKVLKKWFGKTVIRSAAQLSYEEAQNIIDGKLEGGIVVAPQHSASDIEHDIKVLHDLSSQLRRSRIASGTLALDSLDLEFNVDENGLPTDCWQRERIESNELIEEFMLLTNMAVAQHVAVNLPEQALLRRHDTPLERRLATFSERAQRLGYTMDTSSSGAMMRSFEAVDDPAARRLLELLSFKATQRAKYFCAGMLDIAKYQHYALNVPLYTHFTSPIRRYADVLVHRQLEAVLQGVGAEPKFTMDRDAVAKVAQQCNIKRDSATLAEEQSHHLFLCVLLSDLTQRYGPVIRQAKVVGVLDSAFDVLVPEFGIEKRVHVDQMPIENHVYDEHSYTLQIYWSDKDVINWLAENSDDEHLKKVKRNAEQHAVKMEVTSRSVHDEKALFDEDEDDDDEIVLARSEPGKVEETSKQRKLSLAKEQPSFEGLRTSAAGHKIQDIRELMTVPVIVTADLTKSPPVIKVYSVNPYAVSKK